MDIIKLQNQIGYWVWNTTISEMLGISNQEFENLMQKNEKIMSLSKEDQNNVMATVLVLTWLNKNHKDKRNIWKLIV